VIGTGPARTDTGSAAAPRPWAACPLYAIALAIVVLDQLSKLAIVQAMRLGQTIPLVPDFFDIAFVMNPGAAFGIMASRSSSFRSPFFMLVSILAIGLIVYYYHRYLHEPARLPPAALGLILGGAVGNLIDRMRFGMVIDFLDFHVAGYHWPAFNVADAAISTGVGLMLLRMLHEWRQDKAPTTR
jgi:signal peptidase II